MKKVIEIPEHQISVQEGEGLVKHNTFITLAKQIIENTPHKTDTEAYLIKRLRDQLDTLTDEAKEIVMESEDVAFLLNGIRRMREKEAVVGSAWYYIIAPLNEAKPYKAPAAEVEEAKK